MSFRVALQRSRVGRALREMLPAGSRVGRAARGLMGRPAAPAEPRPASYTDDELLARADEFNRAAEVYWKEVAEEPAGRIHALSKPFTTIEDASGILYRLGLVLHELELGVGHTVLDLGSGACWLSAALNRLRCRTISVDVSPTALALGRELFALDPRQDLSLEPRFLTYDGHHIPLPDASVDRVVCFDSFHHVPNMDRILAEILRVLKDGGRAVFAEPGEGHTHQDQSVYETERCGVLENELLLPDLYARARRLGFTEMLVKPYPDPSALTLRGESYFRFMDGADEALPLGDLRASLRGFYVFVLTRGETRHDSRNPRKLRAEIGVLSPAGEIRGRAGESVPVRFRVRNTGDTAWLHDVDLKGGYVMLGGHLHQEDRTLVTRGHLRAPLPRDVAPGDAVEVEGRLRLPPRQGRFVIRLDMVDEWVCWFEQKGSPVVERAVVVEGFVDTRTPDVLSARLALAAPPPPPCLPGSPLALRLDVENTGNTTWLATGEARVALGAHLVDDAGVVVTQDLLRVALPRDVAPGDRVELTAAFRAAPLPGAHRVRFDLVLEGRYWFEHLGGAVCEVPLTVVEGVPDSDAPGLLRATLERLDGTGPLAAAPGARLALRLRAANTGNTRWLRRPGDGQVALGGHLEDAAGRQLVLDLFRAPLPADVPPGGSVELEAAFPAPAAPGAYAVEIDLVAEGVAWFGSTGSPTLRIDLACGSGSAASA